MSTITTRPLTEQLFGKLFDRLDVKSDQSVTLKELKKANPALSDTLVARAFNYLDTNKDGKIVQAEMTGRKTQLGNNTLGGAIADQATRGAADSGQSAVAELFARADVDRDGMLSDEELAAEGEIRRAANLDAGMIVGPIFVKQAASATSKNPHKEGFWRPDEVFKTEDFRPPISTFKFFDEFSPEVQQSILDAQAKVKTAFPTQPAQPPAVLTDEQKQEVRNQLLADRAEEDSGPPGTKKILDRVIGVLRDEADADFKTLTVSPSLSSRLMAQIYAELAAQGK